MRNEKWAAGSCRRAAGPQVLCMAKPNCTNSAPLLLRVQKERREERKEKSCKSKSAERWRRFPDSDLSSLHPAGRPAAGRGEKCMSHLIYTRRIKSE